MHESNRRFRVRQVVVAAIVGATVACGNPFGSDEPTRIRLRNASSFELTAVTFAPGSERVEFARIAPSATTEYRTVKRAYSYGYFDALVAGVRRTILPIDFVGESYIGEGKFTYQVTIDAQTRNPSVQLIRD
jgi:hypothetical protein